VEEEMLELIWGLAQPMLGELVITLAVLGGILGLWNRGKNDARRETALEAAERMAKAHTDRQEIEDEIADDPHLADRARGSGLVRPDR